MPLTDFQRSVLKILRPFRTENTFVGGGAALNQFWPRISDDIDIFNDHRKSLPQKIDRELTALRDAGFAVESIVQDEWIVEAVLRKYGEETKIQWMDEPETSKRFFPAIGDEDFGFRLHAADVAVNKVLCATRRNTAARDAVDLAAIVLNFAPLGPLIWALPAKDASLAPPQIIRDIRKNALGYADEEIRTLRMNGQPISREWVRAVLDPALDRAGDYCENRAPTDFLGNLLLTKEDVPLEADSAMLTNREAIPRRIRDFGAVISIVC